MHYATHAAVGDRIAACQRYLAAHPDYRGPLMTERRADGELVAVPAREDHAPKRGRLRVSDALARHHLVGAKLRGFIR